MKKGVVNKIVVLALLLTVSGCSTTSTQGLVSAYDRPILSAAEAESMIRVEVRTPEQVSTEQVVAASID